MEINELQELIAVAAKQKKADFVIKNCQWVDVYNQEVKTGDIAIYKDKIAGVGENYSGEEEYDAGGMYATPSFIEGHVHIESSYLSPEEFARMVVPLGTGTIVADPHEIANVCGIAGIEYMLAAAKHTALDVKYMIPSCVPSTAFEHAGATITAQDIAKLLPKEGVLGLGEVMNYPGVVNGDKATLEKIQATRIQNKPIDGHSPCLAGEGLAAYSAAGIHTDHECSTVKEMHERITMGMYVLLRNGSAGRNLQHLVQGVTDANFRRCLLCSDDIHPQDIFARGYINGDVRFCIEKGLQPLQAVTMATLNPAECFGLTDRGALAPGRRADICLWPDLKSFDVPSCVWSQGKMVAMEGKYLPVLKKEPITTVRNTMNVGDYSMEKIKLHLKTGQVRTIDIIPGEIVTEKGEAKVKLDAQGDFIFDPAMDLVKLAVIERHHGLGTVGLAILRNFGIKQGAVAVSVAHDSHNIIVTGTNNEDMDKAVQELLKIEGGIALVLGGKVIASLPLPIAGLMSEKRADQVQKELGNIHHLAHSVLGVGPQVDPIMTLSFMALPVIPHIKLTDEGLFDVDKFAFTKLEE
jgi:adenine deaminase